MVEKYLQNKKLFNIILMDIIMPKMDGYESAQKIRELEKRYGVPERNRQFICGYSANVSLRKFPFYLFYSSIYPFLVQMLRRNALKTEWMTYAPKTWSSKLFSECCYNMIIERIETRRHPNHTVLVVKAKMHHPSAIRDNRCLQWAKYSLQTIKTPKRWKCWQTKRIWEIRLWIQLQQSEDMAKRDYNSWESPWY